MSLSRLTREASAACGVSQKSRASPNPYPRRRALAYESEHSDQSASFDVGGARLKGDTSSVLVSARTPEPVDTTLSDVKPLSRRASTNAAQVWIFVRFPRLLVRTRMPCGCQGSTFRRGGFEHPPCCHSRLEPCGRCATSFSVFKCLFLIPIVIWCPIDSADDNGVDARLGTAKPPPRGPIVPSLPTPLRSGPQPAPGRPPPFPIISLAMLCCRATLTRADTALRRYFLDSVVTWTVCGPRLRHVRLTT
jgi:hypothetical protein